MREVVYTYKYCIVKVCEYFYTLSLHKLTYQPCSLTLARLLQLLHSDSGARRRVTSVLTAAAGSTHLSLRPCFAGMLSAQLVKSCFPEFLTSEEFWGTITFLIHVWTPKDCRAVFCLQEQFSFIKQRDTDEASWAQLGAALCSSQQQPPISLEPDCPETHCKERCWKSLFSLTCQPN